jgi:drug/metabolite transporter (DMT)-like permease
MTLIAGVLVALVGLILVGTGGGSTRRRRNYRLPAGLVLIALGALFALTGGEVMLMMGWAHP